MMPDALDRALFEASYRLLLPAIRRAVRVLPTRIVRLLADRADRREAAANYLPGPETARVGILRRQAVDRYDVRSDATMAYYGELRRRKA